MLPLGSSSSSSIFYCLFFFLLLFSSFLLHLRLRDILYVRNRNIIFFSASCFSLLFSRLFCSIFRCCDVVLHSLVHTSVRTHAHQQQCHQHTYMKWNAYHIRSATAPTTTTDLFTSTTSHSYTDNTLTRSGPGFFSWKSKTVLLLAVLCWCCVVAFVKN